MPGDSQISKPAGWRSRMMSGLHHKRGRGPLATAGDLAGQTVVLQIWTRTLSRHEGGEKSVNLRKSSSQARSTGDLDPSRRALLFAGLSGLAVLGASALKPARATAPTGDVSIENFSPAGKSMGVVRVPKVVKTEAEWRKQLSAESFNVTRNADTEVPFTGAYWNNHADGLYRCICCDTALFDSKTKYDSGTGWPSYWKPISAENAVETHDGSLGMERTAVSCKRCDAHLGHVFDDGPRPTGLRYCMNSASLNFVARG
jgi:peptide-methionine (R)-S-oxide reductase